MSVSESGRVLRPRTIRVVRLSYAVGAAVLLVLIVAVGELFLLRAASRADARRVACYVVRYSPDADQTAKEIRAAYHCPPARALPSRRVPGPSSSPTVAAGPSPASVAPSPARHRALVAPSPTVAGPPRLSPAVSATPTVTQPVPSPSGILGGLLCDPAGLPVCLR